MRAKKLRRHKPAVALLVALETRTRRTTTHSPLLWQASAPKIADISLIFSNALGRRHAMKVSHSAVGRSKKRLPRSRRGWIGAAGEHLPVPPARHSLGARRRLSCAPVALAEHHFRSRELSAGPSAWVIFLLSGRISFSPNGKGQSVMATGGPRPEPFFGYLLGDDRRLEGTRRRGNKRDPSRRTVDHSWLYPIGIAPREQ